MFYVAAVRKFLLFSSQLAVRGIPFNLSFQEDIILPVTGTPSFYVGVDFSAEDNSIFFSDTAKDIIFKQKVDGTGKKMPLCGKIVIEYISFFIILLIQQHQLVPTTIKSQTLLFFYCSVLF